MSNSVTRRSFVHGVAAAGAASAINGHYLRAFALAPQHLTGVTSGRCVTAYYLVAGQKRAGRVLTHLGSVQGPTLARPVHAIAASVVAHSLLEKHHEELSRSYLRTLTVVFRSGNDAVIPEEQVGQLSQLLLMDLRDHASAHEEVWSRAHRKQSKTQMVFKSSRLGGSFGLRLAQFNVRRLHNVFYRNEGQPDPQPDWMRMQNHADAHLPGMLKAQIEKFESNRKEIPQSPFAHVAQTQTGRLKAVKL